MTDVDAGQTHAFTLVPGAGDADNGKFTITGSTLKTAQPLDFETSPTYSIRVRATDSGTPALNVEHDFEITVTDTQDPPTAADTSEETDEDTPVVVTLSASDPEGDDVTAFTTSAPTHGTVGPVGAITCVGTPKVCSADRHLHAGRRLQRPGRVRLHGVRRRPRLAPRHRVDHDPPGQRHADGVAGSRTTSEDTPAALNLADFVADVETADGDLTYEIVAQPPAAEGSATATTFTPAQDFNGTTSFTYRVIDRGDPDNCGGPPPGCDGTETSTTETISITVSPVNDAPTASAASRTTSEDTPVALNLADFVDDLETADGDLTYEIATQPPAAEGSATATTFTPAQDFNGTTSFTYKVTDRGDPDNCGAPGPACDGPESATATVTITVAPSNDAPQASAASRSVDEDGSVAVDLAALVEDVETADADLTYTIVAPPTHGSFTGGVYTPRSDFNGQDSFTYKVTDRGDPDGCTSPPCDDELTSTTETVSITVDPVNDAPQASSTSVGVAEDTPLGIDLGALVSDVETSDANLTYTIVTPPAHGDLTGSGGSRTYTPDGDFNGADSFEYEVEDRGDPDNCSAEPCDDVTIVSATRTVSITVDAVNDAPVNFLPTGPVTAVQDTDTPLAGHLDRRRRRRRRQPSTSRSRSSTARSRSAPRSRSASRLAQVAGNGTGAVAISAPLAAINATLADANGLIYHGDAPYTGPDELTVATGDAGHNGAGGPKTDTRHAGDRRPAAERGAGRGRAERHHQRGHGRRRSRCRPATPTATTR